MSWFKDNLFPKWFTPYHKAADSYKDVNGKGLLERYVECIGNDLDTNILPFLDNMQANILDPKSIFASLLPFRETELGIDLVYDNSITRRKQILSYWQRLVQIKGTVRGYEVCIRLMNFDSLIINTVDVITYFDNPIPSAGCDACYEYDVIVTGNKEVIDLTIVDAFFNLINWNEPINCKLRNFIYNDTFVPKKLVKFYFKDEGDANLYVDISRNPTFLAKFDELLDNEGKLLLEDEFAEFYQFDSEFWDNQGFMLYSQPTPEAVATFESFAVTNITQTTATLTWDSNPEAAYYLLNVGLDLIQNGNEIIINKIIDNENIGLTLSYELTGLTAATPYYAQIIAVRADGKQGLSHPQPFITAVIVATPVATAATNITSLNFVANWIAISGANGYEVEISESPTFDVIIDTINVIGNFNNVLVNIERTANIYYRVRAYRNIQGRLPIITSFSAWSNVIELVKLNQKGLKFDAINDYVLCPVIGLPTGNAEVSISVNVDIKTISLFQAIIGYGDSSSYGNITIGMINNKFSIEYGSGNSLTTNNNFGIGKYTLTVTKEPGLGSNAKLYVNGNLELTTLSAGIDAIPNIGNSTAIIGSWIQTGGTAFFLDGNFFEAKIWNRALSPTEVADDFEFNNVTLGLLRKFDFDDKEGFILTDKVNNYNGTIINKSISDVTIGATNDWLYENGTPYDALS